MSGLVSAVQSGKSCVVSVEAPMYLCNPQEVGRGRVRAAGAESESLTVDTGPAAAPPEQFMPVL
jgi:hypothetical protein